MTDDKPYANEKLEYSVIRAIGNGQLPARQAVLDVGDIVSTTLRHCWAPVETRPPIFALEDILCSHYQSVSSLRDFLRADSTKLDVTSALADYRTEVNDWSAFQNPDNPKPFHISSFPSFERRCARCVYRIKEPAPHTRSHLLVRHVRFSPNGRHIAMSCESDVDIYEVETARLVR